VIIDCIAEPPVPGEATRPAVGPTQMITVGELAALLTSFREQRTTLRLPDMSDSFVRALYSTYLSYLPPSDFAYDLVARSDARGELAEFVKSASLGQIFVSRTRPGVTRGNHWHETKVEKFLVLSGNAVIRFRAIEGDDCFEYPVSGEQLRVVDIPPGYTHSIQNVGSDEVITLFWSSEPFEPARSDTFAAEVVRDN
jgi:UDP-2-acetamido-2,6-beta-L-arabino-hexul-4-ose reductase